MIFIVRIVRSGLRNVVRRTSNAVEDDCCNSSVVAIRPGSMASDLDTGVAMLIGGIA